MVLLLWGWFGLKRNSARDSVALIVGDDKRGVLPSGVAEKGGVPVML